MNTTARKRVESGLETKTEEVKTFEGSSKKEVDNAIEVFRKENPDIRIIAKNIREGYDRQENLTSYSCAIFYSVK